VKQEIRNDSNGVEDAIAVHQETLSKMSSSSSKRARRETVEPVSPVKATTTPSPDTKELERLRKELSHKNEVITSMEEFMGKMQRGLCCQVCTELLYQPFNLSCGHVFCYGCLVDWFKEAKRCPTCRERVIERPTVSYLVLK
jgi:predicted Zn-ribbon and HTH transcriptional regulator